MDVQLDKFEQLVFDAQLAVAILGDLETSDFELFDVSRLPLSEDQLSRASRMRFVGVIGIVESVPRIALDEPLDAATTTALLQAFVRHTEDTANAELETQALARLYQLPDTRN
jgi:hypothetical protein